VDVDTDLVGELYVVHVAYPVLAPVINVLYSD
jgi:hypothetical protein